MKKIMLFLAACAISLGGMAQKPTSILSEMAAKKNSELREIAARRVGLPMCRVDGQPRSLHDVMKGMAANGLQKAPGKAPKKAEANITPACYYGYIYAQYAGLALTSMQECSFFQDGEDLYVDLFNEDGFGYIKGTKTDIVEMDGVDDEIWEVTFYNEQEVFSYNGVSYCVYDCTLDENTGAFSKSDKAVFKAYYFPADGDILLPGALGVYQKGTINALPYSQLANIFISPKSSYEEYMYKGTASFSFGEETYSCDIVAVPFSSAEWFIKDLDIAAANTWTYMAINENNTATIPSGQLMAVVNDAIQDENGTVTYSGPVDVVFFTLNSLYYLQNGMTMTIKENIFKETLTFQNTDSYYADLVFYPGMTQLDAVAVASNLNIEVTKERVSNGISDATAAAAGKARKGTFNLAGQKVGDDYRGIVIKDGRKVLNK